MLKKIGLGAALAAVATLGACNTVNGAGKDMRSAGKAVSDASGQDKQDKK